MHLPSGEREIITDYKMKFIDRNAMGYECTLSEVLSYLKRLGYPLENCFISFFSPVFSAYINCGLDPLTSSIKITREDLTAFVD